MCTFPSLESRMSSSYRFRRVQKFFIPFRYDFCISFASWSWHLILRCSSLYVISIRSLTLLLLVFQLTVQRRSSRPSLFEIVDMIYVLDPFFLFYFLFSLVRSFTGRVSLGPKTRPIVCFRNELARFNHFSLSSEIRTRRWERRFYVFLSSFESTCAPLDSPPTWNGQIRERDVSVCPTCPPSTVKRETVKMRHLESVQISGCRRSYSSGLFFFS